MKASHRLLRFLPELIVLAKRVVPMSGGRTYVALLLREALSKFALGCTAFQFTNSTISLPQNPQSTTPGGKNAT